MQPLQIIYASAWVDELEKRTNRRNLRARWGGGGRQCLLFHPFSKTFPSSISGEICSATCSHTLLYLEGWLLDTPRIKTWRPADKAGTDTSQSPGHWFSLTGFARLGGRREGHPDSAWLSGSYKSALSSSEDLYSTEDVSNSGPYGSLFSFCLHGKITVNIVNYPKAKEHY